MDTIFQNGSVWSEDHFVQADIVIRDGRIISVGNAGCATSPGSEKAERIDVRGKYILPGIIDCHWHLGMANDDPQTMSYYRCSPIEGAYRCASYAAEMIAGGFTTVRECGAMYGETVALRDFIQAGKLPGPRLVVCGSAISIPGGHMPSAVHVTGSQEARYATRQLLAEGVDFIKVMLTGGLGRSNEIPDTLEIDLDELEAICHEARRAGKPVAVHAHGRQAMKNAVACGVSTIEHATMLDDALADEIAEKGIFVVPTFSPYGLVAKYGRERGLDPAVCDSAARLYDAKCERFLRAYYRGIKIAYGRDVFYIAPGDVSGEMRFMEDAGVPRVEVIKSATSYAARAIGVDSFTGSIVPGKAADLVILGSDPLADLNAFNRDLEMVIKDGKRFR